RTVIFVSHNMSAISHLCSAGIVLARGQVALKSNAAAAVEFYNRDELSLGKRSNGEAHVLYKAIENAIRCDFAVTRIETLDNDGRPKPVISTWDDVVFRVWYSSKRHIQRGSVILELASFDGTKVLLLSTEPDGRMALAFQPGEACVDCVIEELP